MKNIIGYAVRFFASLLSKKPAGPMPVAFSPEPKPLIPLPPEPAPKYSWHTPDAVRHSMRVMGDEYGMSWTEKDLLCDIARCESGFNLRATLKNSPTSIDRGLFQWNSHYHTEITDEMAYDPETATRLAVKAIKKRHITIFWGASKFCWNRGGKYDAFLAESLGAAGGAGYTAQEIHAAVRDILEL